jgi:hypothetical protein
LTSYASSFFITFPWTSHGILDDVVAEIVGAAYRGARLDAAPGHPDGEGARMVIASHQP